MTKARVLDPDVLAGLSGLSVRVRSVVEGVLSGLHRSPFRGSSSEFAEHKEYASGDELRTIDWKLVGRTDRYYVKQFQDETNLAAYLVLDLSASMDFGAPLRKHDYAAVLAGSLCYLLTDQIDMVGLSLIRPTGAEAVPARAARTHVGHILEMLEEAEPGKGACDLAAGLDELLERMRRRSLVVVISDLLTDEEPVLAALSRLRSRPAEVVLLHVLSPEELRFGYKEASRFVDPEDGRELPADPESVRDAYNRQLEAFLTRWRENTLARGITYRLVDTSRAPDRVLRELLGRR